MTADTRGSTAIIPGMARILLLGVKPFVGNKKCDPQTVNSSFVEVNTTDPPVIENGTGDGKTVEYYNGRISHFLGLRGKISDTNRTITFQARFDLG